MPRRGQGTSRTLWQTSSGPKSCWGMSQRSISARVCAAPSSGTKASRHEHDAGGNSAAFSTEPFSCVTQDIDEFLLIKHTVRDFLRSGFLTRITGVPLREGSWRSEEHTSELQSP